MTVTAVTQPQVQYPWNPYNAVAIKAWIDAVTAIVNGTLPASMLSADTEGRAAMQTGYFNEATATDKFAAAAIVGTLLKAGALAATEQGRALMATGLFDEATATDKFAAGAIAGTLLKAGALAATTQGRALFATGVLDEATVDVAVAAGAIDSDRLKSGSITATQLAADLTLAKRTVTITDDILTGTDAQVVNIGAVLPANAIVLGHELNVTEAFVGLNDVSITVGGTDPDAIVGSTDLDALSTGKTCGTLGVLPTGTFGGEQLTATVDSAAGNMDDLSAGSVTITVWYSVLA